MKKLKLILPFTTLVTIPAVVMPLTACNKIDYFSMTLSDTDEEWSRFTPYGNKWGETVRIQDSMPNYINEFDQINHSIGRDVVFNIFHKHTHPNTANEEMKKIEIKDCFFDTYEWRLSISISISFDNNKKFEMKISNLPYVAFPTQFQQTQNNNDTDDMYVCFAPVGGESGTVLQDKSWEIKWRANPLQKFSVLNHNSGLSTWIGFWTGSDGSLVSGHDCLCFRPYYYWNTKVDPT